MSDPEGAVAPVHNWRSGAEVLPALHRLLQQILEHRWNAARMGDLLLFDKAEHGIGAQGAPRQHQFRTDHRCQVRHTPAVAVKEGGGGEHAIAAAQIPAIPAANGHDVEQRAAVAVEHPFGLTGGSGGEANRRCLAFVELRPCVIRITRIDQIFDADRVGQLRWRRHLVSIAKHDPAIGAAAARRNALGELDTVQVDEKRPVLSVVDRISELIVVQARVRRVQHRTRARHRMHDFEHSIGVKAERAEEGAAAGEPQVVQRRGESSRAIGRLRVAISMIGETIITRHYLHIGEDALGMCEGCAEQQRNLLHHTVHGFPISRAGPVCSVLTSQAHL